jgi:hypothetical protein
MKAFRIGHRFNYLGHQAVITGVEKSIYSGTTYQILVECSGVTLAVNSLSETLKSAG